LIGGYLGFFKKNQSSLVQLITVIMCEQERSAAADAVQ
jgi:hypothetical protein